MIRWYETRKEAARRMCRVVQGKNHIINELNEEIKRLRSHLNLDLCDYYSRSYSRSLASAHFELEMKVLKDEIKDLEKALYEVTERNIALLLNKEHKAEEGK